MKERLIKRCVPNTGGKKIRLHFTHRSWKHFTMGVGKRCGHGREEGGFGEGQGKKKKEVVICHLGGRMGGEEDVMLICAASQVEGGRRVKWLKNKGPDGSL